MKLNRMDLEHMYKLCKFLASVTRFKVVDMQKQLNILYPTAWNYAKALERAKFIKRENKHYVVSRKFKLNAKLLVKFYESLKWS